MGSCMDVSVIEERKTRARSWFESLRNDICAAFERLQHAGKITRVSVHRDSCNESCTYFGPGG